MVLDSILAWQLFSRVFPVLRALEQACDAPFLFCWPVFVVRMFAVLVWFLFGCSSQLLYTREGFLALCTSLTLSFYLPLSVKILSSLSWKWGQLAMFVTSCAFLKRAREFKVSGVGRQTPPPPVWALEC